MASDIDLLTKSFLKKRGIGFIEKERLTEKLKAYQKLKARISINKNENSSLEIRRFFTFSFTDLR
jgi:hypothetical protein